MGDSLPDDSRSDDFVCTVCYQDLSSGAFQVEEHPTVPGVAVCPRCLGSLREVLEAKGGQLDDEYCTWCAEDVDKKLFLCDGDDCGRAFCDNCVDKLGEGTAARVEASDDDWLCPCCDESALARLQALFTQAEQNPPLLSRVLSRLSKSESPGNADSEVGDAASPNPPRLAAEGNPSASSSNNPLQHEPLEGKVGGPQPSAGLATLVEGDEEDDAFAQELIDATIMVENEIATTLDQMDYAAVEERRTNVLAEIRRDKPNMAAEEAEAEVSADMERVHEMWQYMLDALQDIQPVLIEALGDRGLSETALFAETASDSVFGGRGARDGVEPMDEDEEEEEEEAEKKEPAGRKIEGILEQFEKIAVGDEGNYTLARVLLLKCHELWDWLLARRERNRKSGVPTVGADGDGGKDSDDILLDTVFFEHAMGEVNGIRGLGLRWCKRRMVAAAVEAAASFRRNEMVDVERPRTEDVEKWGLTGQRAAQFGMVVRWIKTSLTTHERGLEAASRLDGEGGGGEEKSPPSNREDLVSECRVLERQIKAVYSTWEGSAADGFWGSASEADLRNTWRRLRAELLSALRNADSNSMMSMIETVGTGILDLASLQVEDLGTGVGAYLSSSFTNRGIPKAVATRMLNEAMATEGNPAMKGRSEVDDSAAVNKERKNAVATGSKARRYRPRRAPRAPKPKGSITRKQAPRAKGVGAAVKKASGGKAISSGKGGLFACKDTGGDEAGVAEKIDPSAAKLKLERVEEPTKYRSGQNGAGTEGVTDGRNNATGSGIEVSRAASSDVTCDNDRVTIPLPAADPAAAAAAIGAARSVLGHDAPKDEQQSIVAPEGGAMYMSQSPLGFEAALGEVDGLDIPSPQENDTSDSGKDSVSGGSKDSDSGGSSAGGSVDDAEGSGGGEGGRGVEAGGDRVSIAAAAVDASGGLPPPAPAPDASSSHPFRVDDASVDGLATLLKALGVGHEEHILKPEGRGDLEALLGEAKGDSTLAVSLFFDRAHETMALEKKRAARIATLRVRTGPRGTKCFVCTSTMPGEWKHMRKPHGDGDSGAQSEKKIVAGRSGGGGGGGENGGPALREHRPRGDGGGGGGGALASSNSSEARPADEDGSPGVKSERKMCASSVSVGGTGSGADGKGAGCNGKNFQSKASGASQLGQNANAVEPEAIWVCGRDACLEAAKAAGFVVEEVYTVEHVVWASEGAKEDSKDSNRIADGAKGERASPTGSLLPGTAKKAPGPNMGSFAGIDELCKLAVIAEEVVSASSRRDHRPDGKEEGGKKKDGKRGQGENNADGERRSGPTEDGTGDSTQSVGGTNISSAPGVPTEGGQAQGGKDCKHADAAAGTRDSAREACEVVLGKTIPSASATPGHPTPTPGSAGGDGVKDGDNDVVDAAAKVQAQGDTVDPEKAGEGNAGGGDVGGQGPPVEAGIAAVDPPSEAEEEQSARKGSASDRADGDDGDGNPRVRDNTGDRGQQGKAVGRPAIAEAVVDLTFSDDDESSGPEFVSNDRNRSELCYKQSAAGAASAAGAGSREKGGDGIPRKPKAEGAIAAGSSTLDGFWGGDRREGDGVRKASSRGSGEEAESSGAVGRGHAGGGGGGSSGSPHSSVDGRAESERRSSSAQEGLDGRREGPTSAAGDRGSDESRKIDGRGDGSRKKVSKRRSGRRGERSSGDSSDSSDSSNSSGGGGGSSSSSSSSGSSSSTSSNSSTSCSTSSGRIDVVGYKKTLSRTRRRQRKKRFLPSDSSDDGTDLDSRLALLDEDGKERTAKEKDKVGKEKRAGERLPDADSDSDSDSDEVMFLQTQPARRRRVEGPLDKQQEKEVEGLQHKERERLKRVAARAVWTPPKARGLNRHMQLHPLLRPTHDEEPVNPDHVHVLEVIPPEAGQGTEKVVAVAPFLGRHLLKHQVQGVQFMYDNLVVNTEQLREGGEGAKGNGCILAHCMGLGKTLQAIAMIHVLLANEVLKEAATIQSPTTQPANENTSEAGGSAPGGDDRSQSASSKSVSGKRTSKCFLRTCLVLVPKNVLRNWQEELKKWLGSHYPRGKVFVIDSGNMRERLLNMEIWQQRGGILVMSYSVFRGMTKAGEERDLSRELLVDPGPDVVVADEAHLLKNEEAQVTIAIKKMRTKRRVALTGSPLQNNLVEYYTMVDFVRKGMLGDLQRFKNYFEAPIINGMLIDSSPYDVKRSHGRSHVLHETLRGFVQRRDVAFMAKTLPTHIVKEEIVLKVTLTKKQKALTQKIFRESQRTSRKGSLMRVLSVLQLMWTHPQVYEAEEERQAAKAKAEAEWAAAEEGGGWSDGEEREAPEAVTIRDTSDDAGLESGNSNAERPKKKGKAVPARASSNDDIDFGAEGSGDPPLHGVIGHGGNNAPASGSIGRPGDSASLPPGSSAVGHMRRDLERQASNGLPILREAPGLHVVAGSKKDADAPVTVPNAAPSSTPAVELRSPGSGTNDGGSTSASASASGRGSDGGSNGGNGSGGNCGGGGEGVGGDNCAGGDAGSGSNRDAVCGEARSQGEMAGGGGSSSTGGGLVTPASSLSETSPKRPRLEVEGVEIVCIDDTPEKVSRVGEGEAAVGAAADPAKRDTATGDNATGVVGAAPERTDPERAHSSRGPASGVAAASRQLKRKRPRVKQKEGKVRLLPLDDTFDVKLSAKMVVLLEIIARAVTMGDKVLVFSQRRLVLDFIERVLMTKGWGGFVKTPAAPPPSWRDNFTETARAGSWGPWENGRHYYRLDGTTASKKRQAMIQSFNDRGNKKTGVFLVSTRAGNMGINLVAANRVVLMDTSWNPANDLQAMFRCYRIGQTKPVEVYRLVMAKSLENKMHNKQITKHALAGRVVDARNPGRKISRADHTVSLDAEYLRYEGGDQPGDAQFIPPAAVKPSAAILMTEEDAENMTVEDERLADILGLAEEPAGDAPRGCRMQETPKSGGQGATQPRGDGGGSDAGGLGVGRAPSAAISLLPDHDPTAALQGAATTAGGGSGGVESEPKSSSGGAAGAAATGATSSAAVGAGTGVSGEDRETSQDSLLAHLLKEFHPEFIASWVANKRLLEDDPLEKLDDAGKAEAKRHYDEEVRTEEHRAQALKDQQVERYHHNNQQVHQRARQYATHSLWARMASMGGVSPTVRGLLQETAGRGGMAPLGGASATVRDLLEETSGRDMRAGPAHRHQIAGSLSGFWTGPAGVDTPDHIDVGSGDGGGGGIGGDGMGGGGGGSSGGGGNGSASGSGRGAAAGSGYQLGQAGPPRAGWN